MQMLQNMMHIKSWTNMLMLYLDGKNTSKWLNIVILLIYDDVFFLTYES